MTSEETLAKAREVVDGINGAWHCSTCRKEAESYLEQAIATAIEEAAKVCEPRFYSIEKQIGGAPLELYKKIRAILVRCNHYEDTALTYDEGVKAIQGLLKMPEEAVASEREQEPRYYNWYITCPKCGNSGRMDTFGYREDGSRSTPAQGEEKK